MSIMDRIKDGGIRDLLNNNQNIVVIVCVVTIAVAIGYIIMNSTGSSRTRMTTRAWYYDTVKKTFFVDDINLIPPIQSPDGNPAVKAHFFSCTGDCSEDKRFLAYYEKFTDEAKQVLEAAGPDDDTYVVYETGLLYSMDGENWFPGSDAAHQEKIDERMQCPEGPTSRPRYCPAK